MSDLLKEVDTDNEVSTMVLIDDNQKQLCEDQKLVNTSKNNPIKLKKQPLQYMKGRGSKLLELALNHKKTVPQAKKEDKSNNLKVTSDTNNPHFSQQR